MIIVGATCASWKCNGKGELAWLETAEALIEDAASVGHELTFFASLEVDARRQQPFHGLLDRMEDLPSSFWTFSLDDGVEEIDTMNRLVRICTGRNLVHEYALRNFASHILFVDTDTWVPGDSISKLLELRHPVVGGEVPNYRLQGPPVPGFDFPVQEHWNTAGFLLVERDVFTRLRWRTDHPLGLSDDPCFDFDAHAAGFGHTWVRKDVIGQHIEPLLPVEERTADKRIHR